MHGSGRGWRRAPARARPPGDQSRNEDAKDYLGATSIKQAKTSIGLGQVVVSTARKHDLFADLLRTSLRQGLSHDQIAELLVSEAARPDPGHRRGADPLRSEPRRGRNGGEEVTLVAERRCGDATLRLRLYTQAEEDGSVDLDPALAMLASARCSPAGG